MKMMINGALVEVDAKEYLENYEPTPKEVIIDDLKQRLADTDYASIRDTARIVLKLAEKLPETDLKDLGIAECIEREATRQSWRDEINKLEEEIK